MKFARYLQDTQTPEWKRAYIDYRGLKKRINAIRKAREGISEPEPPSSDSEDDALSGISRLEPSKSSAHPSPSAPTQDPDLQSGSFPQKPHSPDSTSNRHLEHNHRGPKAREHRPSSTRVKSIISVKTGKGRTYSDRFGSGQSRTTDPRTVLPLHETLSQLSPIELDFFKKLDTQLERIESFYLDREAEMVARAKLLHEQLEELAEHKKLVQGVHSQGHVSWHSALVTHIQDKLMGNRPLKLNIGDGGIPHARNNNADPTMKHTNLETDSLKNGKEKRKEREKLDKEIEDEKQNSRQRDSPSSDPEKYLHAKKRLKKAVTEHYRGLEILQNYRILNLTGFRKALKKFEKVTKIPVQQQYMTERVDKSAFAFDKILTAMIKDMEVQYSERFTGRNKKRAMSRLRAGFRVKSHHYSTFRSGIYLGLALPALVSGLHSSFQETTRAAIPGWDGLLYLYGVLLVPVFFSLLVGFNMLVWARSRINYVFIFELDTRTRMDYRQYYEIPSILLATLCYAFWLSFLRIGAPSVSASIWPWVWLGFCFLIMIDPLPLLHKPSRYWLLRNIGKLLVSGSRRVEFTDFWMGDQFCSLVYPLSNVYIFPCIYARGFADWRKCTASSPLWPLALVLASLPLLFRLIQSVKRYRDSGLITHLINAGKYASGIISNLFFYIWRHQGNTGRGTIFILWCLFNTIYAIYSSAWDFLMDWSVLKPHAKHPLLRDELVYSNQIPSYYVAIIINLLIRFIWVFYIPHSGPNILLRLFIGGMLEALRRCLWNFYRLENEHLGNMDQYRATREVPLPYPFSGDEGEDPEEEELRKLSLMRERNRRQSHSSQKSKKS